nr:AbiV family abortive infection protein [Methylocystis silviterrae]
MYGDGPPLLSGDSFAECLAQYARLVGHVEALWDDACRHYREARFPLSTFLSILAIEEVGKLGRLWTDLLAWDRTQPTTQTTLGRLGRDHRKKHFMGIISGAVINARLDRILGKQRVKQLLQDVESGKIETVRQSCLYIDMMDGKVVLPEDVIDREAAKFYVVLAGELWAEILGHFPWEFERMIEKVTAFEIEIGFSEEHVKRR